MINNNKITLPAYQEKELFFVQKILVFVQKIKKRPDKFEET